MKERPRKIGKLTENHIGRGVRRPSGSAARPPKQKRARRALASNAPLDPRGEIWYILLGMPLNASEAVRLHHPKGGDGMYLAVTFHFRGYSVSIHIKKLKTATPVR